MGHGQGQRHGQEQGHGQSDEGPMRGFKSTKLGDTRELQPPVPSGFLPVTYG